MPEFFLDHPGGRRRIEVGPALKQGAAGTIHRSPTLPGTIVKLYIHAHERPAYRDKVDAMLADPPDLPPFEHAGRSFVQIAWPTGRVVDARGEFRGFAMPEVDFSVSTELENMLQKARRRAKNLPEFYGTRVLLAANLAALLAELHRHGHHMIDMKPINLRCYPQVATLAILDTDGFSVAGKVRHPAKQFTPEYIAPEARGATPAALGLEQDLFALAVIVFRLMNNGIHPFQGVDGAGSGAPTDLQERVFARLYPYGLRAHPNIAPSPSSLHAWFETETRALFDRAFTQTAGRTTAAQWRDHLRGLIESRTLRRCKAEPDEHAHFSAGCGLCALQAKQPGAPAPVPPRPSPWGRVRRRLPPTGPPATSPPGPPKPSPWGRIRPRMLPTRPPAAPPPGAPPVQPPARRGRALAVTLLLALLGGGAAFAVVRYASQAPSAGTASPPSTRPTINVPGQPRPLPPAPAPRPPGASESPPATNPIQTPSPPAPRPPPPAPPAPAPSPPLARLTLCNLTGGGVLIAVASRKAGGDGWVVSGWRQVLAGCQDMGSFQEGDLLVAALDETGKRLTSPGAQRTCVPRRFHFEIQGLPTGPCPSDAIAVDLVRLVSQGGQFRLTLR